eukprot:NODE_2735_length_405_cov_786.039326_g2105_i2.p4 GENE.NODE_2735_length_405_cov_786.039326_g2105_i2~~NODE_2735_length_405_cov_786.039326_g2105_i2.p4  ORF type:complete len:50 (-),score=10.62 NODE_2735_length_405_cov_786.039326_g2105_i2:80-229(-)
MHIYVRTHTCAHAHTHTHTHTYASARGCVLLVLLCFGGVVNILVCFIRA